MTVTEYLIERALREAKKNFGDAATPQHVVNYLQHSTTYDAMAEYLKDFDCIERLATPFSAKDGVVTLGTGTSATASTGTWVSTGGNHA